MQAYAKLLKKQWYPVLLDYRLKEIPEKKLSFQFEQTFQKYQKYFFFKTL